MNTECITLDFLSDGYRLTGHLHLPSIKNPPVVIGSHGLLATQESPKQLSLAKACTFNGMGYFRFDHRGCGQSEGKEPEQLSFKARCNDLIAAYNTIRQRSDTGDEIAIFGSSLGGAVAIRVSTMIQIETLVTFAAPVSTGCIVDTINKSGLSEKYPPILFEKLSFDNQRILSDIHGILIIHGEYDEIVPVSEAHKIFQKARNPKKLIIQKSGDHRMSSKEHQNHFVCEVIKSCLTKN